MSASVAPELHAAPILLANDLGFFKDQGLDAQLDISHAQIDTLMQLLAGNKLDWFTANTDASLNNALQRGADIKAIAAGETGQQGWHYAGMLVSDKLWQSGTHTMQDFPLHSQIDLTAGLNNTAGRKLWRYLKFNKVNDPLKDYTIKEWLNPAPVPQAFAAGQIQAVFSGQPRASQLAQSGPGHILGWDGDAPDSWGEPGTMITFNNAWIKPDPERAIRFCMGYLKGIQVYLDQAQNGWKDPKMRGIVATRTQTAPAVFDTVGGPWMPPNGQVDAAKLDAAVNFFKTTIPAITGDVVPSTKYVDYSFVKEAASRLGIK